MKNLFSLLYRSCFLGFHNFCLYKKRPEKCLPVTWKKENIILYIIKNIWDAQTRIEMNNSRETISSQEENGKISLLQMLAWLRAHFYYAVSFHYTMLSKSTIRQGKIASLCTLLRNTSSKCHGNSINNCFDKTALEISLPKTIIKILT